MKEVKQGLDFVLKFKAGAKPTTATSSDAAQAFREDISFSVDLAVRKIYDSQGNFSHYKKSRPEGTLSISAKYVDETELFIFNRQIVGQSVPFSYAEIQFLSVDEVTIESLIQIDKIALDTKGKAFPVADDATASLEFQFGQVPTPASLAEKLLT